MAGFSSALLTRKAFLSGSAKVGRSTNGAKTFALFKKAEKQAKKIAGPAKQNAKKAQSKVASHSQHNISALIGVLTTQASWAAWRAPEMRNDLLRTLRCCAQSNHELHNTLASVLLGGVLEDGCSHNR